MRHKILFNGLLYAPDGTGISRYAERLVKEFVAGGYAVDILLRDDYKQQYGQYDHVLFAGRDIHSSGQRIITEQWQLHKLYRQYDLVHFPDYATPVFTSTASMASVHDLSMKTMRQQRTWKQNVVKNTLLQNTVYRAAGVLCSSEFTRQELLNYYPQLESRSQTVHLGVKPSQLQEWSQETLQIWQLVPQQYILYVGTLAPHKNLVPLIQAFGQLYRQGYMGKLVLAGGKGWMYDDIFAEVARLQLQQRVVFTGYVQQDALETLYHFADCFVTTSLYEGFGLPPLEAMIRGIPVLVSDIPVFHETVADCGFYCNPKDAEHIAAKLMLLLSDKKQKNVLAAKGMRRAQQFNWQRTAQETWQFYQKIMERQVS